MCTFLQAKTVYEAIVGNEGEKVRIVYGPESKKNELHEHFITPIAMFRHPRSDKPLLAAIDWAHPGSGGCRFYNLRRFAAVQNTNLEVDDLNLANLYADGHLRGGEERVILRISSKILSQRRVGIFALSTTPERAVRWTKQGFSHWRDWTVPLWIAGEESFPLPTVAPSASPTPSWGERLRSFAPSF